MTSKMSFSFQLRIISAESSFSFGRRRELRAAAAVRLLTFAITMPCSIISLLYATRLPSNKISHFLYNREAAIRRTPLFMPISIHAAGSRRRLLA